MRCCFNKAYESEFTRKYLSDVATLQRNVASYSVLVHMGNSWLKYTICIFSKIYAFY